MTQILQRTALILLASSALEACASGAVPNFPISQPPAPPVSAPAVVAPPAADDTPKAQPTAPVEVKPLEAPPPSLPPVAPSPAAPPPTPRAYRPPAPTPAPPRTVTRRTVTGRVVEVQGPPTVYEVREGDTLARIARELGTTVEQLKDDNGLSSSAIHPGQQLNGPSVAMKAYVAGPGDTLYAIARRFGLTADSLRRENGLSSSGGLRLGQKIRLPDGYRDRGPITTQVEVSADPRPASAPPPTVSPDVERPALEPAERTPAYRTVTTRSVTGRVVEIEGPAASYSVKKGDNLEKVARKLDTTVDQLRDDNRLRKSTIQPGQVLKGPRATAKAYVVGAGDTLGDIARRFDITARTLASENGLSRSASVRPGQKLRLPDGYRDRGPLSSTARVLAPSAGALPRPPQIEPQLPAAPRPYAPPAFKPPAASPPVAGPLPSAPRPYSPPAYSPPAYVPPTSSAPRPYVPPPTASAPRPYVPPVGISIPAAPPTGASLGDAQVSSLGRGRFVWPLRGDVISDYGPKAAGQRNDGINVRAASGDPVRAAAGGDVVYAGDQVPGFGNLVLIKHPDGWVTAYGHLARTEVRMQQKVAQGQEIGQVGATGGVAEPQLHFEVRFAPSPLERARPIDPKLVLPR